MSDRPPQEPPAEETTQDTKLDDEEQAKDAKDDNDDGPFSGKADGGKLNTLPKGSYITGTPTSIDVHPLVLLSVVDHFARINTKVATSKRVVGLLLGNVVRKDSDGAPSSEPRLDINNCFGVPFDEDLKNRDVWFLDTNYAEETFLMYKKVYPRAKVIGWYSSGPLISQNDVNIHLLVAERFCPNPVYCIVNTDPAQKGVPVQAYITSESRGAKRAVEFRNIASNLGTVEAEDIGIEHLLRDLTDSTITTLSTKIGDRQLALERMEQLLANIEQYLNDVISGRLPMNAEILNSLQELVNTLPLVHRLKNDPGLLVTTNDDALHAFVATISRCVTSMYDTIINRRKFNRDREKRMEEERAEKQKEENEKAKKADAEKEKSADEEKEAKK